MNSKLKNQVRDWAKTHLMSYEDSHLEYYSLRLKTGVVKNNLVSNFGSDVYVSKRGRVYKHIPNTSFWRELPYSVTIHYNGLFPKYYVYVTPHGNKHLSLSRLVATVWVKKIQPNHNIVMHLDDDRLNNRYTNLQWGTQKQNVHMAVSRGHHSKAHRDRRLTLEQEDQLMSEWRSGKFSQRSLAKKWGFKSQGSIQSIIRRNQKRHKDGKF